MMDGARPEGPGNEKTWTIGRLVQLLRDDFPDLSISKVRYLEDRNLLHPVRTAGGYRKYGEAELRQLRTILTLQRDEFLPLDIIRDRLARGTAIPFSRISEVAPLEEEGALWREERLIPEDEIIRTTGLDRDFLRQLSEFHLVDRDTTAIEPSVKETDAEIARVCGELAKHMLRQFATDSCYFCVRLLHAWFNGRSVAVHKVKLTQLPQEIPVQPRGPYNLILRNQPFFPPKCTFFFQRCHL